MLVCTVLTRSNALRFSSYDSLRWIVWNFSDFSSSIQFVIRCPSDCLQSWYLLVYVLQSMKEKLNEQNTSLLLSVRWKITVEQYYETIVSCVYVLISMPSLFPKMAKFMANVVNANEWIIDTSDTNLSKFYLLCIYKVFESQRWNMAWHAHCLLCFSSKI